MLIQARPARGQAANCFLEQDEPAPIARAESRRRSSQGPTGFAKFVSAQS